MSFSRQSLLMRMDDATPEEERLVVEPLFLRSINEQSPSASLDFHLGNRFLILPGRFAICDASLSKEQIKAETAKELFVPFGQELPLYPGQFILGTTLEWLRLPNDLAAYITGRSIWGRRGLLIVTASAIYPGSSGTVTLEMTNLGPIEIPLKPGMVLGQLLFHKVAVVKGVPPFLCRTQVN